jgi:tryptophan synthase alpha chain
MRLKDRTQSIKARREKALVAFLTAGFPDEGTFLRLIEAASQAGCQVIEVGIPFSDPIADGPIIQQSSKQALENGITLRKALALVEEASKSTSAALVLMSYFNPILRMGLKRFAEIARDSGISGVIVPDVPLEESAEIRSTLRDHRITLVDLVAPTSGADRIQRISEAADGFLYLVSVAGVTGVRSALSNDLPDFVGRVREQTDLPLYVGFGVSTAEHARIAARSADGVIVGSALIKIAYESRMKDEAVGKVGEFLRDMKQAINGSGRSEES